MSSNALYRYPSLGKINHVSYSYKITVTVKILRFDNRRQEDIRFVSAW